MGTLRVMKPRVFVIGLDCLDPHLIFERWWDDLPTLRALAGGGIRGRLRSTDPPITVPAWSCMMSSQDPGQLGFYGFRNRKDSSYDKLFVATGLAVKKPRVWDILAERGRYPVAIGVPQTFPVPRLSQGLICAGFLSPDKGRGFIHPPGKLELLNRLAGGDYIVDVSDFRTDDKERLLSDIYAMTDARFRAVEGLMTEEPWSFFMFVEMGTDRIHHGFWRFMDLSHRLYEPGHRFENAIHDYYVHLDGLIARLLERLRDDDTVLLVSDHGAKPMTGALCVNEWLEAEGLLTFKEKPTAPTRFSTDMVDWSKTKAWGEGGYYSRIFFNVLGREPEGTIPPAEVEPFRRDLIDRFESMLDHEGKPMGTRALRPEDVYREVNGIAPDLIVYFGDLSWRSAGQVGGESVFIFENDTGPDDANHDHHGVILARGPSVRPRADVGDYDIMDVAPTILDAMGEPIPEQMNGKTMLSLDE